MSCNNYSMNNRNNKARKVSRDAVANLRDLDL